MPNDPKYVVIYPSENEETTEMAYSLWELVGRLHKIAEDGHIDDVKVFRLGEISPAAPEKTASILEDAESRGLIIYPFLNERMYSESPDLCPACGSKIGAGAPLYPDRQCHVCGSSWKDLYVKLGGYVDLKMSVKAKIQQISK